MPASPPERLGGEDLLAEVPALPIKDLLAEVPTSRHPHRSAVTPLSRPAGPGGVGPAMKDYSPRCRRVDIARWASRRSCRSRNACRLSYSRLTFATASSTFALPSWK